MDVKEAKAILDECDRDELRDHAFGDREISWTRSGFEVAYGFDNGKEVGVHMVGDASFEGDEARNLIDCGELAHVERNDQTGPPDFVVGRIMPGLTRQAVKQELVKQHIFRNRLTNGFRHQ